MTCAHSQVEAALDRWLECHWHIHQMEGNYHYPDPFRYALNSYIRTLKEIPQILSLELQNHPDYRTYFQPAIASTRSNALIALLHNKRDFIVHRGMLDVESKGLVGTTEGREGSRNSDSVLSGSLASPRPSSGGNRKERGDEKNPTESWSDL